MMLLRQQVSKSTDCSTTFNNSQIYKCVQKEEKCSEQLNQLHTHTMVNEETVLSLAVRCNLTLDRDIPK